MSSITIAVTKGVLAQVQAGNIGQRQLAIQDASADLRVQLDRASAANIIQISLGGCITLGIGDTHAIWRAHQAPGSQTADFDDLFSLLARRGGAGVTLTW